MSVYLDPITHPDAWDRLAFPTAQLVTPGKCVVGKWTRDNEYDVKAGKGTQGATETLKQQPPAKGTVTFWAWIPAHFAAWDPILDLLRFDPAKGGNTSSATASAATTSTPTGSKGQTFGQAPVKAQSDNASGSGGASAADNAGSGTDTSASKDTSSSSSQPALSSAYAIEVFHPALADINVHYLLPPEKLGSWEPDGEPSSGLWKREIEFLEFTQPPNKSIATTPTGAGATNPAATYAGAPVKSAADDTSSATQQAASGAQGAHGL